MIKTAIIKLQRFHNKINRFFMRSEPEDLLRFIKTAPSEYDEDKALLDRMDYYEDYAKRY